MKLIDCSTFKAAAHPKTQLWSECFGAWLFELSNTESESFEFESEKWLLKKLLPTGIHISNFEMFNPEVY